MSTGSRVDAYIAKSPPFAQPILKHLRNVVAKGSPHVEETIKWGMPFFTINGKPFCLMAAFKNHCRFGLWSHEARQLLAKTGKELNLGMGANRRIASLKDLPGEKKMISYIRKAAELAAVAPKSGSPRKTTTPKPEPRLHPEFAAALKKNTQAAAALRAFSPTHRREYLEWVNTAKQDQTRASRIATAIQWLAQGKSRNWKYQSR